MAISVIRQGDRWIARFPWSVEVKDIVKAAGFRFDGPSRTWYTLDEAVARRLDPATAEAAVAEANRSIAMSRAVATTMAVPAPAGLAYYDYQEAGVAYALARKDTLIADEMGLGKTIQAIGLINSDPSIRKVLIICPATLKINWRLELQKWLVVPRSIAIANGQWPNADIVITNYDILKKWRLGDGSAIDAVDWDLLVVDEAHYLKNEKTQRTKLVLGNGERLLPIKAKRKLFLTGTPIVNRPRELWTLLHALDPHDLGRNFFAFGKRYCAAHQTALGYWDFNGASNTEELQQRLRAKFMIRRLKADVLTELPPKQRQIIVLTPDRAARATIAAERAVWGLAEDADDNAYADAVSRLRQRGIPFEEIARRRHDTAVAKIPQVIEHLRDCLDAEEKVVVFVHHHDVAHAIEAAFPEMQPAVLTGETAMGVPRQMAIERFQADPRCRLFIASIMAAGVGITLTAARLAVFAELDWVPGNVSQAEDRLHRIGQISPVLVQHLVFDGSIDARMASVNIQKQVVIEAAVDSPIAAVRMSEAQAAMVAEANRPGAVADNGPPDYGDDIPF
jgi:SWI/SNF-related matrix-associated actin-dependent regulator 1 of chromatin subfamily A